MRRFMVPFLIVAVLVMSGVLVNGQSSVIAQDATPSAMMSRADHPLVGTWVVDPNINLDGDTPGLGIWTSDGIMTDPSGLAGSWEVIDAQTALVTFVNIFPDGSGYVTVRGPHVVDETGNTWTSDYSWTIVAPDGTVLESGEGTARGTRLGVEPMDMAGQPLSTMHTWVPQASAEATPAP